MTELTTEQIRKMGLNNFHYVWIEKNIGVHWVELIANLPNEKQWILWDELRLSKMSQVWDTAMAKEKN